MPGSQELNEGPAVVAFQSVARASARPSLVTGLERRRGPREAGGRRPWYRGGARGEPVLQDRVEGKEPARWTCSGVLIPGPW